MCTATIAWIESYGLISADQPPFGLSPTSGATRTVVLFIFEVAFGRWELGYATAAAEMLFLLILVVTLTQYWATSRADEAARGR